MTISYRLSNFDRDEVAQLFDLFTVTYGDASKYKNRWGWEYEKNPQKNDFKVLIAVDDEKIVGATTRLPIKVKTKQGIIQAAFSVNSMVHPDYRRMGIMDGLYKMSADIIPVLYSKGTLPGMYKLLMRMGYTPITPNTFMVSVLSPIRWGLWKTKNYTRECVFLNRTSALNNHFQEVERFKEEFDEFWARISDSYPCITVKDSKFMNWRYIDNPLKKYKVFYQKRQEKIVSVVVLSQEGKNAKIVDILWDQEEKNEPGTTIKFARSYAKKCGFVKLICWGSMERLRSHLKKNSFWDMGETPQFSAYSASMNLDLLADGNRIHFVDGDSDTEYLS